MTERTKAELDEMRRRMEAAQDKPADIDHFFRALQYQPEEETDILWEATERRLTSATSERLSITASAFSGRSTITTPP